MAGLEEKHRADGGQAEAGGAEGSGNRELAGAKVGGWKVNLGPALMDEPDVDFDEQLAAGQGAALGEPGPGHGGAGDKDPGVLLGHGEVVPASGDGAEGGAAGLLRGSLRIERNEGGLADHAVAGALPDEESTFPRFGVGQFHDSVRMRIHQRGGRCRGERRDKKDERDSRGGIEGGPLGERSLPGCGAARSGVRALEVGRTARRARVS